MFLINLLNNTDKKNKVRKLSKNNLNLSRNDKIIKDATSMKSKIKTPLDISQDVILEDSKDVVIKKDNLNEEENKDGKNSQNKSKKSRTKSQKKEKAL